MNNILDLIPQRAPIVMVDELLGIDHNMSRTRFTVCKKNIFVDNDILSECGLIEHIAQSAAARVGYVFKSNDKSIPIGYIGSVNEFIMFAHPKVGDVIETSIEVVQEVFSVTLIQAHCYVGNTEIATCKMKIFLESNEA